MINAGSYSIKMILLTAISMLPYKWLRLMAFMWRIAIKPLNFGSYYISTFIKEPYIETVIQRGLWLIRYDKEDVT